MAVRNDFTAGEVLAAADLNDTFASKLAAADQTVVQIVRATDTTRRTTTSTSFVDVTGMSVTITPTKTANAVLLIASARVSVQAASGVTANGHHLSITDASNNGISGAEEGRYVLNDYTFTVGIPVFGINQVFLAYATPATTSAVTYKVRHKVSDSRSTASVLNDLCAGQLYAIEVTP